MSYKPKTYAWGGSVLAPANPAVPNAAAASLPRMPRLIVAPRGPLNPVTLAKRQNGVPGMKKGGRVKKK